VILGDAATARRFKRRLDTLASHATASAK